MSFAKSAYNYKMVVSQGYLCVFACLEMILKTRNISLSQQELAEFLGVNVKKDYNGKVSNIKYQTDENLLGVTFRKELMSDIFKHFKLPFREHYLTIREVEDEYFLEGEIVERLKNQFHIICGFSYGVLYNTRDKEKYGHVSIITAIENRVVTLLDPGPLEPGKKEVKIFDLFEAIYIKNGGLWLISNIR